MATESLSDAGFLFLEKYFTENDFALTRHHIDSYEQCILEEIPSIIRASNPIVLLKEALDKDAGVFAYRLEIFIGGAAEQLAITVSPPVVVLDNGNTVRRMFPNEARLRNLTYAAQFNADILIRVTFTKAGARGYESEVVEKTLSGFPLFRLPILLRSSLCATSVVDPFRQEEMGECRNDYGGYFIIGGAEKILITRSEQAFNSLYVEKKPASDTRITAYASVVSLNPENKQTRRVALYMARGSKKTPADCIRVAVPMIRGVFPLFVLFRALGVESDEEIVRMIFPATDDPLQDILTPSIEDAYPIYNKYTATKYIMSLTKGFTEAHVLDILQNLMLPHVPDEPMARAHYLAEMTREMILANVGLRGKTDRDDMRNQRFLSTGTLVRELFNACWKEWKADVTLNIDRTYRLNEQLYKGASIFDLFADSNVVSLFQPALLNQKIMRGFRGKWGTTPQNEKTGVLQPLARISYLDAMSHTRRVVADFDTGMKTTGPRKLHTSQVGYFCTSETPTGAHIGVTKNMSIMTQYSLSAPTKPIYDWMRLKGGLIPISETTAAIRASAAAVQINGGTVGFTVNPQGLVRVLRLLKWTACLSPTASISFNTTERTVRILLDEGRPIRPLWHFSEGVEFLKRLPDLKAMSWSALVFGTMPATKGSSLRSSRFLDPLGDKPDAMFAEYEAALAGVAGFIEYCDPVEMNEAYISWWGSVSDLQPEHTHAEIHPSTLTGLMASMIPYSNHNQAPRNQLSNSQSKQGIGTVATNLKNRYETYSHQLCYGESPICRTFTYETIGNGEMPYGFNCVIAATSESGYNQDDGLIINRDSVARGMFQSLAFRSYDCAEEVDSRTKVHSHVANPAMVPSWTSLRPGLDYSKLDERGIIRENEIIDANTVLVGRYMVIPDTNDIKDDSVTPGLYTQGRVDSVVVLTQGFPEGNRLLVKIRVIEMRIPQIGDKFSSRHGQKGTIGMFVSAADLPRTADGIVPDVMVNPGGLISRMTVAQLVEMVAGRMGVEVMAKLNATTFCNGGDFVRQLGDVLEALGLSRSGDNILYSGITGIQIRTDIFMCPLYFMRLKHLTDDKVNSRGAGKREIRTHQPTGGRANEGGLRIGEMERDSLCAHGVSTFLQESMMKRGDATDFWVCNGCGRIPIYNELEKLFVCTTCDGPITYSGLTADTLTMLLPTKQSRATFSKIAVPYSLKLLDQELSTFMNAGFRFVTESSVTRLKDVNWNWPTTKVEFVPGEGIAEAVVVNPEEKAAAQQENKPKRKKTASASAAPVQGLRFSDKPDDPNYMLSIRAPIAFRITENQLPGPDGTQYPALGIAANGSVDPNKQTWPTVDHYFRAMKFAGDPEWQESIRVSSLSQAAQMSKDPGHPARGDWLQIRDKVMKIALLAKFRQNPAALAVLQATGDTKLIDTTTGDAEWFAGTKERGDNRIGAFLEEVRAELKDVRADQALLAPVAASVPAKEESLADQVAAASGGIVRLSSIPEGSAETNSKPVQQGGVYLFINSAIGPRESRRSRDRGTGRNLQWEGMKEEEQLTTDTGTVREVNVEKLDV